MKPETMMIDDVKHVRADAVKAEAPTVDGLKRCIIRSYAAGVFIGYVKERRAEVNGVNVVVVNCKRIHYWSGACSLTQLALDGTNDGDNCRITDPVAEQEINNVIEILPVTEKASKNIDAVKVWKK